MTNYPEPHHALAFDTDWVPQFVLDHVMNQLLAYNMPATIFCTSPYDFPSEPLLEKAWHPNFMPGSTQGDGEESCLDYLKSLYPDAVGSRSHRLYWHSGLRKRLMERGIRYDASLQCPLQTHLSHYTFAGLTRFPIWWSDGLHLLSGMDLEKVNIPDWDEPGLKTMVFHPIHIYCNTRDYNEMQPKLRRVNLPQASEVDLAGLRNPGPGVGMLFSKILKRLTKEGRPQTLKDLCPPPETPLFF
jgi:hypothetical protein